MSALGQKQTFCAARVMSAYPRGSHSSLASPAIPLGVLVNVPGFFFGCFRFLRHARCQDLTRSTSRQLRPNFPELHFLLAITHHITTSDNFVNPTTNIVRLVEVNQIHRRG